MRIRKSAIKEDKQSILTLVRAFSGDRLSVHFWRGEWYAWTGTHYEQVGQQGIEQQAMAFLEENSPTSVNGSMIRRFLDLLRIVRYADHLTAPCWLTTGELPARRNCSPSTTGYCTSLAVQGSYPMIRHFSIYRPCPTIIAQRLTVPAGDNSSMNYGVIRCRSNYSKNGLAIVCCRIRLNRKYSPSAGLREVGKAPQPESCGHCSAVATSRVRPFGR